jgi:uncharacterized protein
MKTLVNYIITSIVDNPGQVKIEEADTPQGMTQLNVRVDPEDMGKVIGKRGNIIKAVRSLLRVKTILTGQRAVLVLKED